MWQVVDQSFLFIVPSVTLPSSRPSTMRPSIAAPVATKDAPGAKQPKIDFIQLLPYEDVRFIANPFNLCWGVRYRSRFLPHCPYPFYI